LSIGDLEKGGGTFSQVRTRIVVASKGQFGAFFRA